MHPCHLLGLIILKARWYLLMSTPPYGQDCYTVHIINVDKASKSLPYWLSIRMTNSCNMSCEGHSEGEVMV